MSLYCIIGFIAVFATSSLIHQIISDTSPTWTVTVVNWMGGARCQRVLYIYIPRYWIHIAYRYQICYTAQLYFLPHASDRYLHHKSGGVLPAWCSLRHWHKLVVYHQSVQMYRVQYGSLLIWIFTECIHLGGRSPGHHVWSVWELPDNIYHQTGRPPLEE